MHTNARFYESDVDLFTVKKYDRPFSKKLFHTAEEKCVEYLGKEITEDKEKLKKCKLNVMVAMSCVLTKKANTQVGDLRDNVGLCKHEIQLANEALTSHFNNLPTEKFNHYLEGLSKSTKSF
jgi:hypothetical protein